MLFLVRIEVSLPHDLDPQYSARIQKEEREYAQRFQREGKWLHLWRIAGRFGNYSVFDVKDNDELNELIWNLPMFHFMKIDVIPIGRHPSALQETYDRSFGDPFHPETAAS
jgi:muconolactone D-isomerase